MIDRDDQDPELVECEYVEAKDGSLVLKGSPADPAFPEIPLTPEQEAATEISIVAHYLIEQTGEPG